MQFWITIKLSHSICNSINNFLDLQLFLLTNILGTFDLYSILVSSYLYLFYYVIVTYICI